MRDPDRWYDSIAATIFPLLEHLEEDGGLALPGDVVMARTFPSITADRARCTKEGWEPLCAFLGVPVPEGEPFPRHNETAEFNRP